jgi:two-component system cell cycle response regulator DivK
MAMTEVPGPLVLIVDDNEQNAKLARDVLRAAGFRTIEAVTGAEAIARATSDRPDVILMDIRLPDMDGAVVARQLKGDPRTTGIPIVALTALASRGAEAWSVDAGFDGYLEKPIDVRAFPDEVRRLSEG